MHSSAYIGNVLIYFYNDFVKVNHDNEDVGGGDVHEADETEQSVQRDLVCLQNGARQLKQTQCCAAAAEVAWEPHISHFSRSSTAETFGSENIVRHEMKTHPEFSAL